MTDVSTVPADVRRAHAAYRMMVMQAARRAKGGQVRLADAFRTGEWAQRIPIGVAVLDPAAGRALIRDERLVQGWPAMMTAQAVPDGPVMAWLRDSLLCSEDAAHTRLRRFASRVFTRSRVEAARAFMREQADQLVQGFKERGHCEFVTEFASPYPAAITARLLFGLPPAAAVPIIGWTRDLSAALAPASAAETAAGEKALTALNAVCDDHIEMARRRPDGGAVAVLSEADGEGDRLTDAELRSLLILFLFAGQDAGRDQLSLIMHALADRPGTWAAMRRGEQPITDVVDDLLRDRPALQALIRTARADFSYRELDIRHGDTVLLMVTPGESGDIAFGAGVHHCLGANLARVQLTEALISLSGQLSEIKADSPGWGIPRGIGGPVKLPLTFAAVR
jgi:cytochrome P450